MNSARLQWALLGGGPDSLIGRVHRIAAAAAEEYRLVGGVFTSDIAASRAFARSLELDPSRTHATVDAFIAAERERAAGDKAQVVTVATPNFLHYEMASKLIDAGFHVICEKPVTTTVAEAESLAAKLKSGSSVFAVTHTYTGYPMVRQMRAMIAAGMLGSLQRLDVQYYQGWINPVIHDPSKRREVWRLDPKRGGASCCVADIGVHAFNLVEYATGLLIKQVLADVDTAIPDNPLDVDASILLRTDSAAKGVMRVSQIATAEENSLEIKVYGRLGALKWAQENPNRLEFLQEGKPLTVLTPGHDYNLPPARAASQLPPGHPEGLIEAMGNLYRGVARAIHGQISDRGEFPDIEAGVRGMRFIEAVLKSAREGNVWASV
ncbi:MAG TPA: Gfo/Idh/MocA family oxidoreductase [Steroidobacteraceae bacterium]|jgi:hypothetical protein